MRGAILGGSLCDGGIYWINRPAAHQLLPGTSLAHSHALPLLEPACWRQRLFRHSNVDCPNGFASKPAPTEDRTARDLRSTVPPQISAQHHQPVRQFIARFGHGHYPCRTRLAGESVCSDTATLTAQTGSPASRLPRRTIPPEIYGGLERQKYTEDRTATGLSPIPPDGSAIRCALRSRALARSAHCRRSGCS
jgi:hypothetical protein